MSAYTGRHELNFYIFCMSEDDSVTWFSLLFNKVDSVDVQLGIMCRRGALRPLLVENGSVDVCRACCGEQDSY